jgi:hypothetical protein
MPSESSSDPFGSKRAPWLVGNRPVKSEPCAGSVQDEVDHARS